MSKTWVYADPHFYHKSICKFNKSDGSKLRPWDDAEQMTDDMIRWYNECVDDKDRVYILGDVAFSFADMLRSVSRLKGRKCLVPGNHDPKKLNKYIHLFDDVRGYVQRDGFIMSHIPIHESSMGRWKINIHGHLHANRVLSSFHVLPDGYNAAPDPRYVCVSVEHTNFRPIELDVILKEQGLK
jgi:calcineurin-like phosphoesterase family protein